jgi:hypothetical protein
MNTSYTLKIKKVLKGRVVNVADDGTIYIGRNYRVYACDSDSYKLTVVAQVPPPLYRRCIEPFRLLCRLMRHEMRGFGVLPNGDKIVAPRQGLFYAAKDEITARRSLIPQTNPPLRPPMTIIVDSMSRILWGEYWGNFERREVRICMSSDNGRSYQIVFSFKPSEIRHIHSIQEDPFEKHYWIFAGDHGNDPGIGILSRDFKNFEWVVKGEQKYRAVNSFIFPDRIVYGTDTEKELNGIYSLDKKTAKATKLCDTPGSSIFASKFGKWYVLSTSVEYFEKHTNNLATLWVSSDADCWQKVFESPKDIWSKKFFQFGGVVLPSGNSRKDEIAFSGQAVRKFDNRVCIAEIIEEV